MKKLKIIISMFLLAGCAQDMGHYVVLPVKSPCKIVTVAPNRYNIDENIYQRLVEWARHELPSLNYQIVDTSWEGMPKPCGEVVLHYSRQLVPNPDVAETPSSTPDEKVCVSTPMEASLYRYELTLDIQDLITQEKFFSVSTEVESTDSNTQKILSDMQTALHAKFLSVQGPESQVATKTTSKILPA